MKGVCDSEGCLEMTLPGGRCFDITASKSRHPTLKRSESLKLPGPRAAGAPLGDGGAEKNMSLLQRLRYFFWSESTGGN